jgi:hypothetical protein
MTTKNNPKFKAFMQRRAARHLPVTIPKNRAPKKVTPTAETSRTIDILTAQSKFIDHFYHGKYTPEQRQIIAEEYKLRHQKQLSANPQDVDKIINQAKGFLKRHREHQLSLGRGKQDLRAIADEISTKYDRNYQRSRGIGRGIRQVVTNAVSTRRNVGRILSTAGVPERIQQTRSQITSIARQISRPLKAHFSGTLKATFFQFGMLALQTLVEIYQEQKQVNKVLYEEDTFEKNGLVTEKDFETHVISKYQVIQLKASDYKSVTINEFKNQLSKSITGKYFVKQDLYDKISKDYHWTVTDKNIEGKDFIGQYSTHINSVAYLYNYYYKATQDVTEKLLRYVGLPTLVNDQKKMEWFRFQLKFNVAASYNILGTHYDIKKLGDEYEAQWNDGDTAKKPLGLTIDQWIAQHGQEADAYQAYLHPDPNVTDGTTEKTTEAEVKALLYVYLETVASDPESVYQYLRNIKPALEDLIFQKIWDEYNQWRIQRGLLVVSLDSIAQRLSPQEETPSQIPQSDVMYGESVTPLSTVFGPLYKEQIIRFERQFK